jgi:hypothetical protein
VSDKTGWEGRAQQLGTGIATVWTLSQALDQAKENKYALEFLDGYIVCSRWELKQKFRVVGSCKRWKMNPLRPLILVFAASWVILLCGCGVSSQPPIPLQSAPTASLPSGTTDTLYAANLSASGGLQPYSWSIASGNAPPGLVLSPAGTLYGTPSSAGTFTFTAQVTDSAQPQEVAKVLVTTTIVAQLLVTTASLSNGSPNVFYSAALSATGGTAPYAWSVTQGSLPAGLSLNATTGVVSGTPTDIGSSSFSVQVSDGENPAATASASLSIALSPPASRNAVL